MQKTSDLLYHILKFYNFQFIIFLMEEDSVKSQQYINYDWHKHNEESPQLDSKNKPQGTSQKSNLHLQDLHKAKLRFKAFMEDIGRLKQTPIRQDIIMYCGGYKKSEKTVENYVRPQILIKKLEMRIQKMIKTKRIKRNWGEQDLKILIWIVSKYSDLKNYQDLEKDITQEDWNFIASLIPGVTAEACMFKWLSIKKITLAAHNWTPEESQLLSIIVRERIQNNYGGSQGEVKDWKEISQELYTLNEDQSKVYRNAKQCREHWTCYLSPHLKKGPWQLYQDLKLLKFIKDNDGLKKWSQIARYFQGRTENALKNRYTLLIDKQKKQSKNRNKTELQLISEFLQKSYVDQFTVNVKTEADSIVEVNHSVKIQQQVASPLASKVKKEDQNFDANGNSITPVRVQKFNINDFQTMNINFFKNIQPGVIQSNGTFKKIINTANIKVITKEFQTNKQPEFIPKETKYPFTITPLNQMPPVTNK